MTALFRLLFLVFVLEALFYLLLSVYIRSLRREKLEAEWDRRHPDRAGPSEARREFVNRAMHGFRRTLKARLVWLVFIIPTIVLAAIVYVVNWQ